MMHSLHPPLSLLRRGLPLLAFGGSIFLTVSLQATLRVAGGSLMLAGGHLSVEDSIEVHAGATLVGEGTLGGTVSIAPNGELQATGNLTITDSLHLAGNLRAVISGSGAGRVVVHGALNLSGAELFFNSTDPHAAYFVLVHYGSLSGGSFSGITNRPPGYSLDYAFDDGTSAHNLTLVNQHYAAYRAWATDAGLEPGDNLDPNADPDDDLLSNLAEWAFGLDPNAYDSGGMILNGLHLMARGSPVPYLASISNGVDRRAVFPRRSDHTAQGLTYTVQFSGDMGTWYNSMDTPIMVDSDDDIEVVTVDYPLFLPDRTKAQFFRVIVESENW